MKSTDSKIQKLALLMSLILMLFVAGCASSSGGSGSSGGSSSGRSGSGGSQTLKQVDLDVSPKMTRFNNLAASSGGVTQGEKDRVNGAYAQYQAAYKQALQAAGNNPDAPAPANVSALATQVIGAIDESVP